MKKKENISLLKELHFLCRKCVLFLFLFLFTHSYIVVAQDNNATLVQRDTVCFSQGTYRFMGVDVPLSVFLGGRVPDKPLPLHIEYRDTSACEIRYYGLTILPSSPIVEYYDTICSGESYTWNGNTYTKPGSYTDTLTNIHGCDSVVTLHLEVLPDPAISFTVNGVSFKMMRVRAGTFMMGAMEGDTEAEANEKPAHPVTLTRDYFVSETVLTQELWTAVMGTTIQEEEEKRTSGNETNLGYGPNFPMYCLSHKDCQKFVERLNQLTGLTFRMPTEAEWEYAARGGHLSRGYKYPGSNDPLEVAWSMANDPQKKLHPVKLLKPNELGLYDMAGNVWEYIYDFRRTYTTAAQIDPLGDTITNKANIRGGSSFWETTCCRTSYRHQQSNITKDSKSGRRAFRFVLDADRVIGEDNTTHQAYDTICAGESYTWNGNTYTKPGSYTDTLTNIYGCDSIVTLHLTINKTVYAEETVTACDSYTWNGQTYTTSGDYPYPTTAANGCDSITTLHLTINKTIYAEETVTACDSYTWNGQTYTTSGDYPYTTTAANGCDSITTLHLTINKTVYAEETITACDSYDWNGQAYTESGNYTYTTTVANGCDSITTLHLTINKTVYEQETVTACDSYDWNGQTYTESGNYTYTTTAANGCDSITTLHLTINYRDTAFFSETACDNYEWHDNTYTTSGTYYYHTQTIHGCDSVEVLNLTLLSKQMTEMTDTMVGYLPYLWNGQEYTTAGTYYYRTQSIEGCDSIVVLHLLANPVDVQVSAGMEYCADSGQVEIALETAGFIDYLSLSYRPSASQYGLRDTIFLIPENGYISLPYTNMRAGIYDVQIGAYFRNECVVMRTLRLVFDYPTTIFEQQWNDLIAILTHDYNGGYDFTAFQWYRDGECLLGETHSYLHQPLDFGAEYTVLLTNEEGVQLMSCPFIAEDKSEISIYPTMLSSGEEIRCRSTIESELYIYSSSGKLLRQLSIPQGTTMIAMPYPIGVYMFKFVSNNHIKQFKVIVS